MASTAGKLWGNEVQAANRWTERMSSRSLPSILNIGVGNFLCRWGNQHLLEKRVQENVVSSCIHQHLMRSPSRQRMFRNLQTILSILCHILVDFLRLQLTAGPTSRLLSYVAPKSVNHHHYYCLKWGMRRKVSPLTIMFGDVSLHTPPLTPLKISK